MSLKRKTLREIATAGIGLRLPTWPERYYVITELDKNRLVIPDLKMDLSDAYAAEDLFFNAEKAYSEANQIPVDTWGYPENDDVTLRKAPTGVVAGDKCEFYVGLPAGECNAAIDEALASLWFPDTVEVTLVADQNEIDLTAGVSWLTREGQLFELKYRETKGTKKVSQRIASELDTEEIVEAGSPKLKVYLWDVPSDVTSIKLQVKGKHYYEELAEETTATNCPQPLIVAAAKVAIIKRLPKRLKEAFIESLVTAQRDLADARKTFLPLWADKPLTRRSSWPGPEVPCDGVWSW